MLEKMMRLRWVSIYIMRYWRVFRLKYKSKLLEHRKKYLVRKLRHYYKIRLLKARYGKSDHDVDFRIMR